MTCRLEDPENRRGRTRLKKFVFGQLPLEAETSMFILVNVIDFLMTYLLLISGLFRESNPVADYFLNRWGPVKGLLYFKMSMVAFVCVISQVIATQHLEQARWVLRIGIVVVSGVVVYSLVMYLKHSFQ